MISANSVIENALMGLYFKGEEVAVAFLFYEGRGEPYIVYSEIHKDRSYSADNFNEGYFSNIDIEICATSNYLELIEEVLTRLEGAGLIYEPNKDSGDLYDPDTKYYHKTLCFGYPIQRIGRSEESETEPIDDVVFPLILN